MATIFDIRHLPRLLGAWKPAKPSVGQAFRIMFGIACLVTVVWVTVPHLLNTISTKAVINARVTSLRSPIKGTIVTPPPPPGTMVSRGDLIATVEDRTVDRSALEQHRAEARALKQRIAARERTIGRLEAIKTKLQGQRDAYRDASVARLQDDLLQADARLRGATTTAVAAERRLDRMAKLHIRRVISNAALDNARATADRLAEEVLGLSAASHRIEGEIEFLRRGVFAAQARNDVPYSQQRIDEIELRQVEERARIEEHGIRIDELHSVIAVEFDRYTERAGFELYAPSRGIIWRRKVNNQAAIAANNELASLIDCSQLLLNVLVHEKYFEDIHPGDSAKVSLIGGAEVLYARVRSLRGMGASAEDDQLAAKVPELEPRHFLATLTIDGQSLSARSNDFCHVGRSAEVSFQRKHGFFHNLGHLLNLWSDDEPITAGGRGDGGFDGGGGVQG